MSIRDLLPIAESVLSRPRRAIIYFLDIDCTTYSEYDYFLAPSDNEEAASEFFDARYDSALADYPDASIELVGGYAEVYDLPAEWAGSSSELAEIAGNILRADMMYLLQEHGKRVAIAKCDDVFPIPHPDFYDRHNVDD